MTDTAAKAGLLEKASEAGITKEEHDEAVHEAMLKTMLASAKKAYRAKEDKLQKDLDTKSATYGKTGDWQDIVKTIMESSKKMADTEKVYKAEVKKVQAEIKDLKASLKKEVADDLTTEKQVKAK